MDVVVDIGKADSYQYQEKVDTDEIILDPHSFLLGETAEGISIPPHLAGWIEGKSGRARHGVLVHCTAPHIAPGWGRTKPKAITLELVNLGPVGSGPGRGLLSPSCPLCVSVCRVISVRRSSRQRRAVRRAFTLAFCGSTMFTVEGTAGVAPRDGFSAVELPRVCASIRDSPRSIISLSVSL